MAQRKYTAWLSMALLIFAGEMIFSLPFHITRFFRPTVLEAFEISNTQLGDVFAVYGITAMLCYFPGGILADRFPPKDLIAFSLVATACGGLFFAQFPSQLGLVLLYLYWGVTSILLFWSALHKATREWGGTSHQGKAFGILDGGRGLIAALVATIATWVLTFWLPDVAVQVNPLERKEALKAVVYFYSFMTLLAGVFVYLFLPRTRHEKTRMPVISNLSVMKQKVIWLQALVVVCAYCGFKGIDNYSLYAVKVLNYSELDAAQFMSVTSYLRPVAALAFGFLADRILANRTVVIGFTLVAISYAFLGLVDTQQIGLSIVLLNLIVTFVGVFGVRGIYFALVQESGMANRSTGAAIGFVSLLGFTPDIFFNSLSGRILDGVPGIVGFQYYFLLLCGFSLMGVLAASMLYKINKHAKLEPDSAKLEETSR